MIQRPEYLGGGSSPVNISPVAQTSSTDTTSPQGNLSAIGTTVLSGHSFTKSFTEHTIVIGLVSVRTDLTYQQGLNRMFSRETIYDYYWPTTSTIGEQAVKNKEIYAQPNGGFKKGRNKPKKIQKCKTHLGPDNKTLSISGIKRTTIL